MYHDSGLCGFLKGTDRIINKKAALCEDLKFAQWQNDKLPREVRLPQHKLLLAKLTSFNWGSISFFPDISEYKGYKNS
jgi:hypothetical protein